MASWCVKCLDSQKIRPSAFSLLSLWAWFFFFGLNENQGLWAFFWRVRYPGPKLGVVPSPPKIVVVLDESGGGDKPL